MNGNPKHSDLIRSNGKALRASYAMSVHPNPKWWKYRWRVFHRESPEGRVFLSTQELSTHEAMTLIKNLEAKDEGYLVYNNRDPRNGEDTPFNLTHINWKDYTPALACNENNDLQWQGHK